MEFFPETDITAGQAEVIARGMLAVARAEAGMREAELGLVKSFFSDLTGGDVHQLVALERVTEVAPDVVATALGSDTLAHLFLKSCILVGYADGEYTPSERSIVEAYAKALRVEQATLQALEQSVKEYLVGQLAGLSNVQATAAIARKLKL
ncbi:MAG TPA: TerB family tellurite resistance protein [Polyangiaceae bacterium]